MSDIYAQNAGTDDLLVSRCQAHERGAFDALVARYQDRVYNFVRRMVNDPSDAEDLAQEVFVRAYRSIDRFDYRASVSTWLFKIASNLCIDHARKKGRRPETVSMTREEDGDSDRQWDVPDNRYHPEQALMEGEMKRVIEKAIKNLSPKLKEVLLLHDVQRLSYEEIAQAANCPLGTVKSRLFLARAELQKTLKAYLNGGA